MCALSVKNYNYHITLLAKIRIYEKLIKENKISESGSGARRLDMLYEQMKEYQEWLSQSCRKKGESFSPALEEWEWV